MGRRRRSSKADTALIAIALVIGAIAAVPKEVWFVLGGLAVVAGITWVAQAVMKATSSAKPPNVSAALTRTGRGRMSNMAPAGRSVPSRTSMSSAEVPVAVRSASFSSDDRRLPARPASMQPARWIEPGQSVTVHGMVLTGGMLYVGGYLPTPNGYQDPCLIDPKCPIAARPDPVGAGMGYWPSYSEISSGHRRAYLDWLAGGREHPDIDVGFVFLYFYGLERRALVDARTDPAAERELPAIAEEVARLLALYGERSASLRRYAGSFQQWLLVQTLPQDLPQRPLPDLHRGAELPASLRLALALVARSSVPLPADLALAWVRLSPTVSLKGAMARAPEQFDALFRQKYRRLFGEGLVLPKNRTKFCVEYRPASSAFRGQIIERKFDDLSDVSVLTGPIGKLAQLAAESNTELAAFTRAAGREAGGTPTLESLLQLPPSLWPETFRTRLDDLKRRVRGGVAGMSSQDLHQVLDAKGPLTRERMRQLARALEAEEIGMEPDVLNGARLPKAEDPIVIFASPAGEPVSRKTAEYQAAQLMLQLSSAVATADGQFGAEEMRHLAAQLKTWAHLTPAQQRRLMAHLRLLVMAPMTIAAIKKRVDPLPAEAKEAIAEFMVATAHADGRIDAAEVKLLEKAYRALSIDPKRVFSDLHGVEVPTAGADPARITGDAAPGGGLQLDRNRVAALQRDTDRVSALLTSIFTEEEETADPMPGADHTSGDAEEAEDSPPSLLGLDAAHAAFARALIARPHWSREEAGDVAADLELMLDGALERINEAAFELHDVPLTEGDDPLEINSELLEQLH